MNKLCNAFGIFSYYKTYFVSQCHKVENSYLTKFHHLINMYI